MKCGGAVLPLILLANRPLLTGGITLCAETLAVAAFAVGFELPG